MKRVGFLIALCLVGITAIAVSVLPVFSANLLLREIIKPSVSGTPSGVVGFNPAQPIPGSLPAVGQSNDQLRQTYGEYHFGPQYTPYINHVFLQGQLVGYEINATNRTILDLSMFLQKTGAVTPTFGMNMVVYKAESDYLVSNSLGTQIYSKVLSAGELPTAGYVDFGTVILGEPGLYLVLAMTMGTVADTSYVNGARYQTRVTQESWTYGYGNRPINRVGGVISENKSGSDYLYPWFQAREASSVNYVYQIFEWKSSLNPVGGSLSYLYVYAGIPQLRNFDTKQLVIGIYETFTDGSGGYYPNMQAARGVVLTEMIGVHEYSGGASSTGVTAMAWGGKVTNLVNPGFPMTMPDGMYAIVIAASHNKDGFPSGPLYQSSDAFVNLITSDISNANAPPSGYWNLVGDRGTGGKFGVFAGTNWNQKGGSVKLCFSIGFQEGTVVVPTTTNTLPTINPTWPGGGDWEWPDWGNKFDSPIARYGLVTLLSIFAFVACCRSGMKFAMGVAACIIAIIWVFFWILGWVNGVFFMIAAIGIGLFVAAIFGGGKGAATAQG